MSWVPVEKPSAERPSKTEFFNTFAKIGYLSFGGPAAQISLMHRYLVDEKKWLTEQQFLNALSFCMLLPGPEAMQLATYSGWRLRGISGGLIAGLLFVVPGALVMLALGIVYALYGKLPVMTGVFLGVKAAVLVIVLEALLKVSKRALRGKAHWAIAALAFVGIFFLSLPYPLIVAIAAVYGFFFAAPIEGERASPPPVEISVKKTLSTIVAGLVLWLVPVWLVDQLFDQPILGEIGAFFSKLAVVTFGGAYAVLAYMGQDVVTHLGWLTAGEMMDGLGLAETTPGPLILVTEFVGFLAGFQEGGLGLGLAGALVTLWVTFVPCFLWIFTGAPYIDWISHQPRLSGALQAITAAVVGVILNLSVWFGLHVLFGHVSRELYGPFTFWVPDWTTFDWRAGVLCLMAGFLLLRLHWSIPKVLLLAAIGGLILNKIAV